MLGTSLPVLLHAAPAGVREHAVTCKLKRIAQNKLGYAYVHACVYAHRHQVKHNGTLRIHCLANLKVEKFRSLLFEVHLLAQGNRRLLGQSRRDDLVVLFITDFLRLRTCRG